jgi:hypothetical protein
MGDLVLIEIFLNGEMFGTVPTVPTSASTSSPSTSFRVCSSAFDGLKALSSEIKFTFLLLMPPFSFNI